MIHSALLHGKWQLCGGHHKLDIQAPPYTDTRTVSPWLWKTATSNTTCGGCIGRGHGLVGSLQAAGGQVAEGCTQLEVTKLDQHMTTCSKVQREQRSELRQSDGGGMARRLPVGGGVRQCRKRVVASAYNV